MPQEKAAGGQQSPKTLDKCGNFNVYFKKGVIGKKQIKEIKNYGKLHCV
mgnify:CR=1 FL=1